MAIIGNVYGQRDVKVVPVYFKLGDSANDACSRPEKMTPLSSSMKMSPYGKGDSVVIERKGTATGDGVERGGTGRPNRGGGGQAHRPVNAAGAEAFGSL